MAALNKTIVGLDYKHLETIFTKDIGALKFYKNIFYGFYKLT